MRDTTGYKENLIVNARYQMALVGGLVKVIGSGNKRKVRLNKPGMSCTVWFPEQPRVKDLEIEDLKAAIAYMSGKPPFSSFD